MSATKKAVIYLATQEPRLSVHDLDRLTRLRDFALNKGYEIVGAEIVHDPDGDEVAGVTTRYAQTRKEVIAGEIGAIVLWHADLGVPDAITQEDIVRPGGDGR